jgi:hypothetical protein
MGIRFRRLRPRPGSRLTYRSSRRPWGHAGAGIGASISIGMAGLAVLAVVVVAVVFFGF